MATHAPLPWDTTPGKDVVTSARTPERTEMREREEEKEREREYEPQETYQNSTHHKSNNITPK